MRVSKYLTILMLAGAISGNAADTKHRRHQLPVRLPGHIPTKAVSNATFVGHVDPSTTIPVTFTLPLRNQDELDALLQRIYDPSDELYQQYLTAEEFHQRHAPTEEDHKAVVAYAESLGLKVIGSHANRTLVNVSGNARAIERAFNLRLHHYQKEDGRRFFAPSNDPRVAGEIASVIGGLVGLDNHSVWHSYHRRNENSNFNSAHASPSGPNGGYSPADLVTAYNLSGLSQNGAGQVIALFELASYQASDIHAYTSQFGLPNAQLRNILVDGGSGQGIDPEVTLDIELALALAPLSQIYVYEGPNSNQGVLDTYNRIATDNVAKQVSTSWGIGEDHESLQYLQAESNIFKQMATQGQSIYAAAGDSGAYDDQTSSLVVDDPASQPYVCGVGGTTLSVNHSNGAYASESVWNNGAGNGAGGGGVSTVWTIPSWQSGVSTLYSKTHRNVPDVCLNADPNTGYAIFFNGSWTIYGGTSCAAPLWASFTACVNQALTANHQPTLGFPNPKLYPIASGSNYTSNFNDVTQGNNLFYQAGHGYDNATGWGSFKGNTLFASLTNTSVTPPPPPQGTPDLFLIVVPAAAFHKGGTGTYNITVDNIGTAATSGQVSVAITLPAGLTFNSFSGTGWTFNPSTLTATRTTALGTSSSFPPIQLTVNVGSNAPSDVVLSATVSGGGAGSNTTTEGTTILL